jgi:hypothetical protein
MTREEIRKEYDDQNGPYSKYPTVAECWTCGKPHEIGNVGEATYWIETHRAAGHDVRERKGK